MSHHWRIDHFIVLYIHHAHAMIGDTAQYISLLAIARHSTYTWSGIYCTLWFEHGPHTTLPQLRQWCLRTNTLNWVVLHTMHTFDYPTSEQVKMNQTMAKWSGNILICKSLIAVRIYYIISEQNVKNMRKFSKQLIPWHRAPTQHGHAICSQPALQTIGMYWRDDGED